MVANDRYTNAPERREVTLMEEFLTGRGDHETGGGRANKPARR